jgi:hypothetical protein
MEAAYEPKTLQEAIVHFADPDNCLKYLVWKRWRSPDRRQAADLGSVDRKTTGKFLSAA